MFQHIYNNYYQEKAKDKHIFELLLYYSETAKILKIKQTRINDFIQRKDKSDLNHIGSMNEFSEK